MGSAETDESLESYGADVGYGAESSARPVEWLLVQGDRQLVAAALTALVFAGLVVLYWLDVLAFVNDDSVTRVASGMIAGTFSLVTIVVSVNQLILSQELSPAGQFRERLGGVMEFREDVEDAAAVPASPASPTKLLELLVVAIHERADRLSAAVEDHPDAELRDRVQQYANAVTDSTERVEETLEHTEFGTFRAVSVAVDYNEAWQLYAARHLRNNNADALSDDADEAFGDLIEALELFNVAREHFKTTYMQRELTRFSQLTIYYGVPAVLSGILLGLLYADVGGPSISVDYLPYVTIALITVVFTPLALLVAYILRTATVTRRTASIGPMLPQKDPEEGPFEVEYGQGE